METDKKVYGLGEDIEVTVSNQLDIAITTRDQRSFCSIIDLERELREGEEWEEIRNCLSGAPVSEVTLQPGSKHTVELEVGRSPFGELPPGRFRAALTYSHGERFSLSPENSHVATSEIFVIN